MVPSSGFSNPAISCAREEVRRRAKAYSFQAKIKQKIAVAAMPESWPGDCWFVAIGAFDSRFGLCGAWCAWVVKGLAERRLRLVRHKSIAERKWSAEDPATKSSRSTTKVKTHYAVGRR